MTLWTPADITTALWLDAADSNTVTLSSGYVSQWADKSGNSNHAAQGNASYRPVVQSAGINGVNTLSFDGDSFSLTSQITTARAAFFVTYALNGSTATSSNDEVSSILGRVTASQHHLFVRTTLTDYTISIDGGISQSGHASVDGGSLAAGMNIDLSLSAAQKADKRLWCVDWDSNQTFDLVAALITDYTYRLRGQVGELIVLSSVPDTATRQLIEGYLAWKWGLEANLPSGHPYESGAPAYGTVTVDTPAAITTSGVHADAVTASTVIIESPAAEVALAGVPAVSVSLDAAALDVLTDLSAGISYSLSVGAINAVSGLSATPAHQVPVAAIDVAAALSAGIGYSLSVGAVDAVAALDADTDSFVITEQAIMRYFLVITGAQDGTTDITLPMSSFQARRRSGDPTYVQVIIPTFDYVDEIAARINGKIRVLQAYEIDGEIKQTEIIIETDIEDIRSDRGARNQSMTLTGYTTSTFEPKAVTVSDVTYAAVSGVKLRYRLARPYIFLNPGDTVTVQDDGVSFEVGVMSYVISSAINHFELESV